MIRRMIATTMALMLMAGTSYADKLPKPDKKQRQQDIQRLIDLKNDPNRGSVFGLLLNGDNCFEYCMDAYYRPEEEYAKDTAAIKEAYRQNDWIRDMCQSLTEKEVKKYHLEDIFELMAKVEFENFQTYERFTAMTHFCEGVYNQRRKAAERTMPTGKLKHFLYEEYGSSRPDPVYYEVFVDSVTGKATLLGAENRRMGGPEGRPQVAIGEEVLDTICQMIEKNKIYKELGYYSRPHIPDVPEITGGPPSWRFNCELEGGEISTGGTQMRPPHGCIHIANYLEDLLKAKQTPPLR